MKQGIRCSYWGLPADVPPRYYIDKAKRLNIDVVELEAPMVIDSTDEQLRQIRQYAADQGIKLSVGGGSLRRLSFCDPDPEVQKAGIAWRTKMIQKMAVAGIPVFCGPMHAYWPYDFNSGVDKEAERDRSAACMRTLSKVAEDYGVYLCVEVVNRFENPILNTAAEGVAFCKQVDSPNVKLLLDTFHMNIEEDSIPAAIRLAGSYVGHLHTGEGNRKVPGKGHLPWKQICEALADIGYTGYAVMEPVVRSDIPAAQAFKLWRMQAEGSEEALDRDAAEAAQLLRTLWENVQQSKRLEQSYM